MFFDSLVIAKILEHRKTTHRQRVTRGRAGAPRRGLPYRVGSSVALERPMREHEADEIQLQNIRERPVSQRPRKEVGRVLITAIDREPLGDIDFDTARAEGFKRPIEFKDAWLRRFDHRWLKHREETTDPETGTVDVEILDYDLVAARFAERWANVQVYVVRFRVESTPIYLAERPNRHGDYVTTERNRLGQRVAMTTTIDAESLDPEMTPPGVPTWSHGTLLSVPEEAVPPAIIDSWRTNTKSTHQQVKQKISEAKATGAHHLLEERDVSTNERRIRAAVAKGKQRSISTSHEVHVICGAQLRRCTDRYIERLVEKLEQKVDREDLADAA